MHAFGAGATTNRAAAGTPRHARGPTLETRQFGTTFEVVPEVHAAGATTVPPPTQPSKAPGTGSGHNRPAATPQTSDRFRTPTAPDTAYAIAERKWHLLADWPAAERLTAVTDAVWSHSYPAAYRAAYTYAANTVAAAATSAARANPAAGLPLHHLAAAAGAAIRQLPPHRPPVPPADQATLDAAVHAVAATHDPRPPWQRVADATQVGIKRAALHHGAAAATADTFTGWRNRHGDILANGIGINGQSASAWVSDLMASVSGNVSGPPGQGTHTDGARADTGRTAAQLAREDQAQGAPTTQQPASRTRPRPPGQPPAPSTGARRGR